MLRQNAAFGKPSVGIKENPEPACPASEVWPFQKWTYLVPSSQPERLILTGGTLRNETLVDNTRLETAWRWPVEEPECEQASKVAAKMGFPGDFSTRADPWDSKGRDRVQK